MSTRSTIAIELADGTVEQIYNHSDGYLGYTGKVLLNHYSDPVKLQQLIAQGSMSMLGKEIGEKINFNDRMNYESDYIAAQCRFYARDRGEPLVVEEFKDFADYKENHQCEEFEYILRDVNGTSTWFVSPYGDYVKLANAIALEEQEES